MNLPDEIQQLMTQPATTPPARGLADVHGNLGETYAVCDAETLHLFSKRLGENYQHIPLPLAGIVALSCEDDRPFALLIVQTSDHEYRLKFAGMDLPKLKQIVAQRASESAPVSHDPDSLKADAALADAAVDAADDGPLDPLLGFCAALQMLVRVDGDVDAEEMHLVHRAMDNYELVAKGIEYLQSHDADQLIAELREVISGDQKLCLVANMLEIAMADGYLRKEEARLIEKFCTGLAVQEETYKAIYDVMIIKNNLSIMSSR